LARLELDLNEVAQHTYDGLRLAFGESGATLRIPRPLPSVLGDPVRLAEVLHNLIGNALKYNDKPERWVELDYQELDAPGDAPPMVAIAVRDNGIGIAPEHAQDVFRLFRRLHARAAYGGGIGAGLTIARRIVERHGGQMWLESIIGGGTTFWFTLPAVPKG
jgi:signal transduction histidine kinase